MDSVGQWKRASRAPARAAEMPGKDRFELLRRGVGLLLRRALADLDAVPAADEVRQDAGRAGLHAAGFPGRLQSAGRCRSRRRVAMARAPDALVEADHQLRIRAVAQLVDRAALGRRQLDVDAARDAAS